MGLPSSLPARVVGPLLVHWQQCNAVQVVVLGDQGAIPGKKYSADVEIANALSPPATNELRTSDGFSSVQEE